MGNGKLSVVVQAADASLQSEAELLTNDGLYDCAWSELHEHQVVRVRVRVRVRVGVRVRVRVS